MSTFALCVGCGTPLYDFSPCQWCTCESCGNDLRDGFCSLCNSRNSCVYDPNLNSFDCPPDSCHPPHPTYETYSCDSYGNDSHFGYYCQPQFPLNYESEPGYIENYNSYPYDSSSFPQQELCCEDCRVLPEADHCQPPQYTITIGQNKLMEQLTSMCAMVGQLIQKKQKEKQIEEEQVANARYWKIPACCDDDDDDFAITPNEPIDSLLAEFAGELIFLESIPPRINEANCDPEEDIHLVERLFVSFMEEINLSFTPDDPMSSSIEEYDNDDSKRDTLILDELLDNHSLSLPKNESFHFNIPSFSRPPAKPPDGNIGILNIKMMGDNSDQKLSIIPENLKTLAKGFYPLSLHFLSFNWES
nr:hypothetical protein [Tanacetum cinerariifolium]